MQAQLEPLPIDSIKIAPSLVAGIPQNEAAAIVIEAAQCIAKRLGVGMAAEGIDTQEQLDCLRAHGCRLFRGKRISAALNEEKLAALLRDSQPRHVDQSQRR